MESVLRFTRDIARYTSDPSWMCCVPIIHFMGKYSKPFEEGPTKINHDDDNPVWWGISKYADDVDYFKGKTLWDRYSIKYLCILYKNYFIVSCWFFL